MPLALCKWAPLYNECWHLTGAARRRFSLTSPRKRREELDQCSPPPSGSRWYCRCRQKIFLEFFRNEKKKSTLFWFFFRWNQTQQRCQRQLRPRRRRTQHKKNHDSHAMKEAHWRRDRSTKQLPCLNKTADYFHRKQLNLRHLDSLGIWQRQNSITWQWRRRNKWLNGLIVIIIL